MLLSFSASHINRVFVLFPTSTLSHWESYCFVHTEPLIQITDVSPCSRSVLSKKKKKRRNKATIMASKLREKFWTENYYIYNYIFFCFPLRPVFEFMLWRKSGFIGRGVKNTTVRLLITFWRNNLRRESIQQAIWKNTGNNPNPWHPSSMAS